MNRGRRDDEPRIPARPVRSRKGDRKARDWQSGRWQPAFAAVNPAMPVADVSLYVADAPVRPCVDRDCPSTQPARRRETPRFSPACVTARRRRGGLSSWSGGTGHGATTAREHTSARSVARSRSWPCRHVHEHDPTWRPVSRKAISLKDLRSFGRMDTTGWSFRERKLDTVPDLMYPLFERTFERFLLSRCKSVWIKSLGMRSPGRSDGNRLEMASGRNRRGRRG
jgi:hypothetical protein